MKKYIDKSVFLRVAFGFAISLILMTSCLLISAVLINNQVLPIGASKVLACISLCISSTLSQMIISGKEKIIIWALLNILIWCAVLWSFGVLIFKETTYLNNVIQTVISVMAGSLIGTVVCGLIGGRK